MKSERMKKVFTPIDETNYTLKTHASQDEFENRKVLRAKGPSASVIQNILNYSKALSVCQTKEVGMVDMILN